jgi:hypothetical protein
LRSGRTVIEKDAISAAIHDAGVSVGCPEDDQCQRFIPLEEADFRIDPRYPDLPKPRSENVLMIEAVRNHAVAEFSAIQRGVTSEALASERWSSQAPRAAWPQDLGPGHAIVLR